MRTLHADLMTVTRRDWEKVYKSVTRRVSFHFTFDFEISAVKSLKACPASSGQLAVEFLFPLKGIAYIFSGTLKSVNSGFINKNM